jgi:hypothetical protein
MIKEMNSKGYERSGPTPAFDWRDWEKALKRQDSLYPVLYSIPGRPNMKQEC